jgi:putative hydrolase of the HAD superfamily
VPGSGEAAAGTKPFVVLVLDAMLLMIDLDNTLADRQRAFEHWIDHLAAGEPRVARDRHWVIEQDGDGVRPREKFLDDIRRRFGLQSDVKTLLREYRRVTAEGFPTIQADVLRRLDEGRRLGAKVAVVSNGDPAAQLATVRRTGLDGHVDTLVVSGAVGVSKPDPRIFERAAEFCGVTLKGAWMVGDANADVIGGQACSAITIWIRRGRAWPQALAAPDHQVDHVADALDLWLDHVRGHRTSSLPL